jgi:predicted ArsR family transcriptional regulator
MRIHRAILTYLLQVRLLEGRCSTTEEVVRYLSMLELRNTAVKRHIEALVKQDLVETAETLYVLKGSENSPRCRRQ